MEPMTAPAPVHPAPIMDVAPPPKAQPAVKAQSSVLPQPPTKQTTDQKSLTQVQVDAQSKPIQKTADAKPKTSTLPALPIAFAIVFFAALTALAYYAYTKSN